MEDRCLICNDIIPEGRHVCVQCEYAIMHTDEKETHNYCLKCGQKLDWRVEE